MLDSFLNSLLIGFRMSHSTLELVALVISVLAENESNGRPYANHPNFQDEPILVYLKIRADETLEI